MKVTTENNVKEFVLCKIKSVYIRFNDNVEATLNEIINYDFDLNKINCSSIELTNAVDNVEIENHFSKNSYVIHVHIEGIGRLIESGEEIFVFYDIPCDMKIRRLRISGGCNTWQDMFVELEGIVK